MEKSEKFINWLEGMLDASKNKLSSSQVKEIRKKIKSYHTEDDQRNAYAGVYHDLPLNSVKDEEFLKEVERNKQASTMEDLCIP
jgi:hypothetical protein